MQIINVIICGNKEPFLKIHFLNIRLIFTLAQNTPYIKPGTVEKSKICRVCLFPLPLIIYKQVNEGTFKHIQKLYQEAMKMFCASII